MIVINACQQTEIVKDSITQLARSRSQKTPVTPEFRGEEEN